MAWAFVQAVSATGTLSASVTVPTENIAPGDLLMVAFSKYNPVDLTGNTDNLPGFPTAGDPEFATVGSLDYVVGSTYRTMPDCGYRGTVLTVGADNATHCALILAVFSEVGAASTNADVFNGFGTTLTARAASNVAVGEVGIDVWALIRRTAAGTIGGYSLGTEAAEADTAGTSVALSYYGVTANPQPAHTATASVSGEWATIRRVLLPGPAREPVCEPTVGPGDTCDDFERANGPVGPDWGLPAGGLTTDSDMPMVMHPFSIVGGALEAPEDTVGNYEHYGIQRWLAHDFEGDQFVEIEVENIFGPVVPGTSNFPWFGIITLYLQMSDTDSSCVACDFWPGVYTPAFGEPHQSYITIDSVVYDAAGNRSPYVIDTELRYPTTDPGDMAERWRFRFESRADGTHRVLVNGELVATAVGTPITGPHVGVSLNWTQTTGSTHTSPRILWLCAGGVALPGIGLTVTVLADPWAVPGSAVSSLTTGDWSDDFDRADGPLGPPWVMVTRSPAGYGSVTAFSIEDSDAIGPMTLAATGHNANLMYVDLPVVGIQTAEITVVNFEGVDEPNFSRQRVASVFTQHNPSATPYTAIHAQIARQGAEGRMYASIVSFDTATQVTQAQVEIPNPPGLAEPITIRLQSDGSHHIATFNGVVLECDYALVNAGDRCGMVMFWGLPGGTSVGTSIRITGFNIITEPSISGEALTITVLADPWAVPSSAVAALAAGESACDDFERPDGPLGPCWVPQIFPYNGSYPASIRSGAYVLGEPGTPTGDTFGNVQWAKPASDADQWIEIVTTNFDPVPDAAPPYEVSWLFSLQRNTADGRNVNVHITAWPSSQWGPPSARPNGFLLWNFAYADALGNIVNTFRPPGTTGSHVYTNLLQPWGSNSPMTLRFEADAGGTCRLFVNGTLAGAAVCPAPVVGDRIGFGMKWRVFGATPTPPGLQPRVEQVCFNAAPGPCGAPSPIEGEGLTISVLADPWAVP